MRAGSSKVLTVDSLETTSRQASGEKKLAEICLGAGALLAAGPVALLIHMANVVFSGTLEGALYAVAALFASLFFVPAVWYVIARRQALSLFVLSLIVLGSWLLVLVGTYYYWVSFHVFFPADILIWSESEFVNDILKFRLGYPLYSAQVNNESFIYTPGAQMLTYSLSWLTGQPTAIPVFRAIQLSFTLCAAVLAFCCSRRLLAVSAPVRFDSKLGTWAAIGVPFLFLVATNSLTNPFVHALHNDALAQLVSLIAYWLLLRYAAKPTKSLLAPMAMMPALGFLIKQSLAVWFLLYVLYLSIFDERRSPRRVAGFIIAAVTGLGFVQFAGYWLWEDDFFYWVFTVPGRHGMSPLRSLQHLTEVWIYVFLGFFGAAVLIRKNNVRVLLGSWFVWLTLIASEAATSGIGWMLNHFGPGSLIGAVWFTAAMERIFFSLRSSAKHGWNFENSFRPTVWAALFGLGLFGMGMVRIPLRPLSEDFYRYTRAIEEEFEGEEAKDVLLDSGSWIYLREGVLMKDRVTSIGDRGFGQVGDFSGMINRLQRKQYRKILVRKFWAEDFWYDHSSWGRPSGIRQALSGNYREVRRIEGVRTEWGGSDPRYLFSDVSVLVPKSG